MKVYKKLFDYVKDYMFMGYMSIIVSGVSAFLTVCGYYYVYKFIKSIVEYSNYNSSTKYAIYIVICLTLSALLYTLSVVISHKFAFRLETNLRKKGIDGLTNSSFRFFDINSSGYIRKTIDDNASKTHTAVAHMLPDNSQAFIVPLLSLALGFVISVRVGLLVLGLTVVSGLILGRMMKNSDFMKLYQQSLDRLSSETVEYVRGMQVIKVFGNSINSFKSLKKAIVDYSKYAYDYSLSCKTPYVIYQLILLGFIAIIAIPLSFKMEDILTPNKLSVELIMIFFLSGVIMVSFMNIMWAGMNMFNANYAVDTLEKLYLSMQEDKLLYGNVSKFDSYNIEFDNVSFSYGDKKVLKNVSFYLEQGKTYALVGHSGSGKTTIAKLLSGFYKVDGGGIKIGGRFLEEYTKEAIIQNISFVFQDTKLFKTSIYENIALADRNASRDEVMKAIELAGCNEIIKKFETREHTIIGSRGVYLSGGEKQRIAIARAILKDSEIIIMDEASASIDSDNEYELQKALKNLMKNKTVIMISHRISSIKNVDEILVLDEGRIVERGIRKELIEKYGLFSKLVQLYEKANDWRI